jgi:hypothetical protein
MTLKPVQIEVAYKEKHTEEDLTQRLLRETRERISTSRALLQKTDHLYSNAKPAPTPRFKGQSPK